MPLINCEVELILTWSANCVIIYTNVNNQVPTFTITETNLHVPVVTLSTQDGLWNWALKEQSFGIISTKTKIIGTKP